MLRGRGKDSQSLPVDSTTQISSAMRYHCCGRTLHPKGTSPGYRTGMTTLPPILPHSTQAPRPPHEEGSAKLGVGEMKEWLVPSPGPRSTYMCSKNCVCTQQKRQVHARLGARPLDQHCQMCNSAAVCPLCCSSCTARSWVSPHSTTLCLALTLCPVGSLYIVVGPS